MVCGAKKYKVTWQGNAKGGVAVLGNACTVVSTVLCHLRMQL